MIRMRYCLLAEAANYSDDDKVNALGIFAHLVVPELPGLVPRFFVVLCLQGDEGQGEERFVLEGGLWSPQDQNLMNIGGEFHLAPEEPGEQPGAIFLSEADQLVVREEGIHRLRFRWGQHELPSEYQFEMPFPVTLRRADTVSTPSLEVT